MKTGLSDTAAEYIFRNATLTRIAKAVVPYAGELLYLNRMLVARHPNEPIILCYHGVVPDEVLPSRFARARESCERLGIFRTDVASCSDDDSNLPLCIGELA